MASDLSKKSFRLFRCQGRFDKHTHDRRSYCGFANRRDPFRPVPLTHPRTHLWLNHARLLFIPFSRETEHGTGLGGGSARGNEHGLYDPGFYGCGWRSLWCDRRGVGHFNRGNDRTDRVVHVRDGLRLCPSNLANLYICLGFSLRFQRSKYPIPARGKQDVEKDPKWNSPAITSLKLAELLSLLVMKTANRRRIDLPIFPLTYLFLFHKLKSLFNLSYQ